MAKTEAITCIPAPNNDARVRIFRRAFPALEEFAGMHVDAYVLISERYVIICDTLLCPADMEFVMEHMRPELATGRQLLVLNSHADWDHAWGNGYFTGRHSVPIIAHQLCRVRIQSAAAQAELAAYQRRDDIFQQVVLTAPTLTIGVHVDTIDKPQHTPIDQLTHGLTLHGGDLTFELFLAPGHTSDSCALWIPELRLLLAFDALEAPFPLLENAASVQPLINTLQRFLALQPQYVLCSHSRMADSALVQKNLAYVQTLEQRCRALLLTRHPDAAELEHASTRIASPFTEFDAEENEMSAATFYRQAHEDNIRFIMQDVMNHQVE